MKKVLIVIAIVAVVVLAIVLATWTKTSSPQLSEIKLGVILELTGPLARLGENARRGIELAVEEINTANKENEKIVLVIEDDKSDPKEGVSAFRKLINTYHFPIIIGATGSSIVMSCAPIANENKTVLFSVGATSPLITNAGDYIFRNRLSGALEVKAMADFAAKKLNIKKIALLYINTDYGTGNKDVFIEAYKKVDGEVILAEGFDQGETDFKSILTKVKQLNIEGVYIIAVGENGYILRQAREMGINTQFLSTVGIEGPELWKIAGNAANGVIFTVQKFDASSSQKAEHFSNNYLSKYGEGPDLFSALGYDAIYIVSKVVNEDGYNSDSIKKGLYNLCNFQGVIGNVSFDKNGDIQSEVMMKIAKDGKFVPYQ